MRSTLETRARRALDLRRGEGRTLVVMGAFLLLNTANTTVLSAAKNGLFLSAYPAELIPWAVVFAALLTALVAVIFTGVVAGTGRRSLAIGLTAVLAPSVLACRALYDVDPRNAFAVYLWLSAVQVLVLTHAWDSASGLLTGRQAKRILPLIGVGASLGAIVGGGAVAPIARILGTASLLWISAALIVGALPMLWMLDEPAREGGGPRASGSGLGDFVARAGRGMRSVGRDRLLRLLALGLVALTATGTLIDLQLKFLLQEAFERDDITAIYGILSATVGAGTLVLQLWASRVLFPRFGVSLAAMLHGGVLLLAAGGAAVLGGLYMLVIAQALDDILQFSLQKPVEQISLLPFPGRVKSVALTTLGGVLRPLSKAGAGGVAIAFTTRPAVLPIATLISAAVALVTYTGHRRRYMSALEAALARHAVDLSQPELTPLVIDAGTIAVIDRGLADEDPAVVIFSTSLLEQLPPAEALPRLTGLLGHDVAEVRAEAAAVFARVDAPLDFASGVSVARRLAREQVPFVLAALLDTIGRVGGMAPDDVEPFLDHEDADVRRAALVALGRLGWHRTEAHLRGLLASPAAHDRTVGARAVGDLGATALLPELVGLVDSPEVRPSTLEALIDLGDAAVPCLKEILGRRRLPLAVRRSVAAALASVGGDAAREALVALVEDAGLGSAALTSLTRMRAAGRISPVDPRAFAPVLTKEIQKGLRFSAAARVIRQRAGSGRDVFVAAELDALRRDSTRAVLDVLALSYDGGRLDRISSALLSDDPARASNALELLEGTISSDAAGVVMPYMDVVVEGMPLARVVELLDDPGDIQTDPARALLREEAWWPRALALHLLGRDDEISVPGTSPDIHQESTEMIPLIERVMLLKGSDFFRHFPGADLAGIAAAAGVVHVRAGEAIFRQGDDGDAFYVVVKGSVTITRGSTTVATLGPRQGFGEMSLLDREARSATATAAEPTTLLSLDRDSFDLIIDRNPVVARGVYRVLTERLRRTLEQVETA